MAAALGDCRGPGNRAQLRSRGYDFVEAQLPKRTQRPWENAPTLAEPRGRRQARARRASAGPRWRSEAADRDRAAAARH